MDAKRDKTFAWVKALIVQFWQQAVHPCLRFKAFTSRVSGTILMGVELIVV
jgi:hypothetical protein